MLLKAYMHKIWRKNVSDKASVSISETFAGR